MNKSLMLFIFISCFLFSNKILSQKFIKCGGVISNNLENLDSISFENTFDEYGHPYSVPSNSPELTVLNCPSSGYFEINYSDNVTSDMQEVICEVFTYLSSVIPQRSEFTSCGDPIENSPVRIDIMADITDPLIGGTGEPRYQGTFQNSSGCSLENNVRLNRAYMKINGGNPINGSLADGRMRLNSGVNLNWNYDTTLDQLDPGMADLYETVLHEALHILGYASLVKIGEDSPGFYSLWDQILHYATNYEPDGSTIVQGSVIESDLNANCWGHTIMHSDFLENVEGTCSTDNLLDIVVGSNGIAPVFGGDLQENEDRLRNNLSHLNNRCNGQNDIYYIMSPERDISISYSPIREITSPEFEILCEMGYKISSDNYECNGCFVIGQTADFETSINSCCNNFFHSCIDEVLILDPNDLLCNDLSGYNTELEVIDVRSAFNNSAVDVQLNGNFYEITSNRPGRNVIEYTIRGCDGKMQNIPVTIYFDECPECDGDYCENLFCIDDLEDLSEVEIGLFGYPFLYAGATNNSPQVLRDLDNTYLRIAETGISGNEAIALELQAPILPNCTIELNVEVSKTVSVTSNTMILQVWGSSTPPCPHPETPVNYGCGTDNSTDCNGSYIYEPVCIGTIEVSNEIERDGSTILDLNLQNYTLPWENGQEIINFIIFTADSGTAQLDNFNLTRLCIDPDFEHEVNCENLTVTLTSIDQNELNTHHWNFGDGNTSTAVNPVHQYDQPGVYTVTHTVTDECGNSEEFVDEVDLSNCGPIADCDCPIGINYDGGEGTKSSDLGMPFEITGECISISGRLILDDVYTWNDVEVRMLPGAEIIIQDWEDRLNIYNGTEIYGCQTMWRGIVVNPGARLDMQHSEIRDAQFAITATDNCRIQLLNNTFNSNYIGVYADNSDESQFFKGLKDDFGDEVGWSNNTFETTYELLPGYNEQMPEPEGISRAGIEFNDVHDLMQLFEDDQTNFIRNSQFGIIINRALNIPLNSFEITDLFSIQTPEITTSQFGVGIQVSNSQDIEITNCQIGSCFGSEDCGESLVRGINGQNSELSIRDNRISSFYLGINGESMWNQNLVIAENEDIFAYYGIRISNGSNEENFEIEIRDNSNIVADLGISITNTNSEIRITDNVYQINGSTIRTGIFIVDVIGPISILDEIITVGQPNNNSFGGAGINIINSQFCLVRGNTVDGSDLNSLANGLSSRSNRNSLFCCNTLTNSRYGVDLGGVHDDFQLKQTTFGNHNTGLFLINAQIGEQENNGNSWEYGNMLTDGRYSGNPEFIQNSSFLQDPSILPREHDFLFVDGGNSEDWFTFEGSAPGCAENCGTEEGEFPWLQGAPLIGGVITEIDNNALIPFTEDDAVSKEAHWESRQIFYAKLNQNEHLMEENMEVASFYNNAQNGNLGSFYEVKIEMNNLPQIGIGGTEYMTLRHDLTIGVVKLKDLKAKWLESDPNDQRDIEEQMSKQIEEQGHLFDSLLDIIDQTAEERANTAENLIAENNAISDGEIYENNEKLVNDIFLRTVALGNFEFSNDQKDIINSIANQCPFAGGTSVYRARGLRNNYEMIYYDDEKICENLEAISKVREKEMTQINDTEKSVLVYPNPTNGILNFYMQKPLTVGGTISIYNLTGKLIHTENIAENTQRFSVPLGTLMPSVYHYRIQDKSNIVISTGKFVYYK